MPDDKLEQAVTTIKAGDKATGKQLLIEVIKVNPNNETAWLWMTNVVSSDPERIKCLQNVLRINPNNEAAKKGLAAIQQRQANQQPVKVEAPPKPVEPPPQPVESPPEPVLSQPSEPVVEQPLPKISTPPRPLKSIKSEPTKKCPYCAETIKAEAKFCRFCGKDLTANQVVRQSSPQLPVKKKSRTGNYVLAIIVSFLVVCCGLYYITSLTLSGRSSTRPSNKGVTSTKQSVESEAPEYLLELVSLTNETSSSYVTIHGQVKNISGQRLENVEAVVEYYDANGNFVTSDSALIDYNPILPGQTSPFSVITRDNPAIKRYSTSFKYLLGGTIRTKDSRK